MKKKVIVLDIILVIIAIAVVATVVITKKETSNQQSASDIVASKEIDKDSSKYFGKIVTNYDIDKTTGVDWQIFNYDGTRYYLIASDYISYENVPNSTKEGAATANKPARVENYEKAVNLEPILNDYKPVLNIPYQGSANLWVSMLQNITLQNGGKNISVTDYLLDTDAWKDFVKPTAEYAVGGPTVELLIDSYNKKYGTSLECQIGENQGYQVRKDANSEWQDELENALEKTDSQYVINTDDNATGMWLASPSNLGRSLGMTVNMTGAISRDQYETSMSGFRPIVCLKAGTELQEQSDGTYKIK